MAGIVHRYHRVGGRGYRQRVYVERAQPLEQYTTEELYARFRFGNADIKYIADLVRPKLQRRTRRSHSLSVEEQVLIALRFYASGTFYQVVGDNIGVDKSTVSDVVKAVSIALASLVNQFVSLPKDVQIAQTKHKFFLLGNMPNTIGVIDCTHVHIQAPHERDWEYINRKGRRSINIQLVGDADLIITNCVVKWPGSVHDARILRESALYRELQTNRPDGIILGDSAYPLLPWLMTPFLVATTPAQARFNTAHCKTRCAIERLNGVLKRRFACLNYLRVEPQGACNIILACIVLHNIATRRNVPLCDDVRDAPEPVEEPDQPLVVCQNQGLTGRIVRNAIVRHYF
ncbi:putative nuclease HARBI1 [Triplophysa dalaica]|uniref:putative nuclease HARBI1 n=1 Tax=Triplophysa dalaica TaxID=1582913 RepID=UPI0024DFEEA1|nr:putative nuclease HARBI1 [Triplophysa dalaica]